MLLSLRQFSHDQLVQSVVFQLHELVTASRVIELCWIPADVGLSGNERGHSLMKSVLSTNVPSSLLHISDLFPRLWDKLVAK